jgi:pimeloyl-ACP methyl ester carboxylesterase
VTAEVTSQATHSDSRLSLREGEVRLLRGGAGAPLLYLHGGGGSRWSPVHEALSEKFDVIAPDHPGFGQSDVMDDLDTMADLVYHYLDLLDSLGLERVSLAGVSFGGWLAAELAVHSPERFGALVLAAAPGPRLPGHLVTDIFLMTAKQRMAALFHDPANIPETDPSDAVAAFQEYKNLTGLARFGWVPFMSDPKLERRLYRVTARTLVITAEHDAVVPREIADTYVTGIDGARLLVLPGTGHALDAEAAPAFAAAITDFLAPQTEETAAR